LFINEKIVVVMYGDYRRSRERLVACEDHKAQTEVTLMKLRQN